MVAKTKVCPGCKGNNLTHLHDSAHGVAGTHIAGSERYECVDCDKVVFASEGRDLGFNFIYEA